MRHLPHANYNPATAGGRVGMPDVGGRGAARFDSHLPLTVQPDHVPEGSSALVRISEGISAFFSGFFSVLPWQEHLCDSDQRHGIVPGPAGGNLPFRSLRWVLERADAPHRLVARVCRDGRIHGDPWRAAHTPIGRLPRVRAPPRSSPPVGERPGLHGAAARHTGHLAAHCLGVLYDGLGQARLAADLRHAHPAPNAPPARTTLREAGDPRSDP